MRENIDNDSMKVILFTNAIDEKNMREWVAHHLLGFDEIYIFDHQSIIPLTGQFDNFNIEKIKIIKQF